MLSFPEGASSTLPETEVTMTKPITLIHPDIDPDPKHSPAIAAVEKILSDPDAQANVAFRIMPNSSVTNLATAFSQFLSEMPDPLPAFVIDHLPKPTPANWGAYSGGVASATGGLASALIAAGCAGGEVITTSLNYTGVINAILLAGAIPRFVDIDEDSWCMDPQAAGEAVSKKTRAILLTHVNRYVDPSPYASIIAGAKKGLSLIQDASLAIASTHDGVRPGMVNRGPMGATVFSLATSKIISGLGGGIVTANDPEIAGNILTAAYQGVNLKTGREIVSRGGNFKMNDLSAAIALAQLERREELFAKRRQLKQWYDQRLEGLVQSGDIVVQAVDDETVLTHYMVLVRHRTALAERLHQQQGIEMGMWFTHHDASTETLPKTDAVADRFAMLPFHTRLSEADVDTVCTALT